MNRYYIIYVVRDVKTGAMNIRKNLNDLARFFGVGTLLVSRRVNAGKEFYGKQIMRLNEMPLFDGAGI